MGAMALAVTGAFATSGSTPVVPTAFPTPSGGITLREENLSGQPPTMLARAGEWLRSFARNGWQGAQPREAVAATGYIAAYAPLGSWTESTTGVALVPIAGAISGGTVSTPNVVNSCSSVPSGTFVSGSTNPEAVCVSNGTDVYLIDGTTIVKTLTSGGTGTLTNGGFSGGSCTTCGVVVDSKSGNALISVSTADGLGGYQLLNLASQKFSSVIGVGPADGIAEHFALVPISGGLFLALSPTEELLGTDGPDYDIIAIAPPGATNPGGSQIFNFSGRSSLASTVMDTAGLDSTGIIYAMDEFTGNLFLADLTQATATTGSSASWNAPNQIQTLSELSVNHMDGLAVAYGAHEALVEQEFSTQAFGAIKLPATSGTGTPAASDWVLASMPNDPSNTIWSNPLDPHGLTAALANYSLSSSGVVTGSGHGIGLLMNDARTYVAVIDLDALLAAPRQATSGTGSHTVSSSFDLLKNNVVTFVKFP